MSALIKVGIRQHPIKVVDMLPSPLPVYPVANPHQRWARIAIDAAPVDATARYLSSVIVIRPMLNGHLTLHDAPTLALCTGNNLVYKIDSGLLPQEIIPAGAPTVITAPVVTGTGAYGSLLSCNTGTWTNSPTTYEYQWKNVQGASTVVIDGATASTYTPTKAQRGTPIFCTVTARNALGWGASDSNRITVTVLEGEEDVTPMATLPATPDPSAGTLNTTGTTVVVNIPLKTGLTCSALGANGEFVVVYA